MLLIVILSTAEPVASFAVAVVEAAVFPGLISVSAEFIPPSGSSKEICLGEDSFNFLEMVFLLRL